MAKLRDNHWLDWGAGIQRGTALDLSLIDPKDPYAPGADWTTQLNNAIFGTGGLDPAAIRKQALANKLEGRFKEDILTEGGTWLPGQTEGYYKNVLKKLEEQRLKTLRGEDLTDKITLLTKQQEPGNLATQATAKAQSESTESNERLTMLQLLSGDRNAAEDRLARYEMARDSERNAQLQWQQRMEYMDKKEAAKERADRLKLLIAGLSELGASFAA